MKKLIIFFTILASIQAQINLGIGINTSHIEFGKFSDDYTFYEKNNIITLEYQNNKDIYGVTFFINSFGNDTIGIYKGRIKDNNNKGFYGVYRVGLLKGYNHIDSLKSDTIKGLNYEFVNPTVFYDNYSLFAEVGLGYQYKGIGIETNLMGNAIVTSVKISF